MSTPWKMFIGAIVIVAALFGVNYYLNSKNSSSAPKVTSNTQNQPANTAPDNSDAAIDIGLSNTDSSINKVDTDSASAGASFNDKPVQQTE